MPPVDSNIDSHPATINEPLITSTADRFSLALTAHRQGQYVEAKQLYTQVLWTQPQNDQALHLLGFAEFQTRNYDRAIELIEVAVSLRPDCGEYRNNLALAYLALRQTEPARRQVLAASKLGHQDANGFFPIAREFYQRRELSWTEFAIELGLMIDPDSPELHNLRGIAYADQGNLGLADAHYRRALARRPDFPAALNNLGNVLRDQNRHGEAIPLYLRAIELHPNFTAAHNNLGIAMAQCGKTAEAILCYQRVLRLMPNCAEAMNNLANAYRDSGDNEAASQLYRRALSLQPESAEVLVNLGMALQSSDDLNAAIDCFQRAISIEPSRADYYFCLASAYSKGDQFAEAAACYGDAASRNPTQPLWKLQQATVCPTVFANRSEMDEFRVGLAKTIDAVRTQPFSCTFADLKNAAPSVPFNYQFFDGDLRKPKEDFAAIFASKLSNAYHSRHVNSWNGPQSKPRIGLVVTEGHESIFLKSLGGVIERICRDKFDLVVISSSVGIARLRSVIRRDDLSFVALPNAFDHMVRAIDEARCDILYYWEVGTDRVNYFLPFFRLAPIQVTSWGIQVTSGIPNLDYYLSSGLVEPADAATHYSERLVLANSLLTYRERTLHCALTARREAFDVPANRHWYVFAQQAGKFHIDFDEIVGSILRRDEQGILLVTIDPQRPNGSKLRQRLRMVIPDFADRIAFLPRLKGDQYRNLLQCADVLLDAPHFAGVNSTYDGLSLGKAIVTLPSSYHRARYTFGCYQKMGVTDCIAASVDDYVRMAVEVACNVDRRREIEHRIHESSSVLFEDSSAVAEHERIFEALLTDGR